MSLWEYDRLRQAIAFSDLSLVYQQLGQWPQATTAIANSLNLLQKPQHRNQNMVTDDTPVNQPNFVKRFVGKTLIITVVAAYGFGCYKAVPTLTKAGNEYDQYTNNCQIFLSRAKSAGTTGIAKEELGKALSWLSQNYPQDSFEYRDLKADEAYLLSQNQNAPLPASIQDSIRNSSSLIDSRESESFGKLGWGGILIVLSPLLLLILLTLLYLFATLLGLDEEIDEILAVVGINVPKILVQLGGD